MDLTLGTARRVAAFHSSARSMLLSGWGGVRYI